LDGDGIADPVVYSDPGDKILALSGRDGRPLWEVPMEGSGFGGMLPPVDLDGDGIPDVVAGGNRFTSGPTVAGGVVAGMDLEDVQVFSGKTGRRIWSAHAALAHPEPKAISFYQAIGAGSPQVQCHDLDGDGRPEVLFVYWSREKGGEGQSDVQGRLVSYSVRDGKVLWEHA